MTSTTVTAEQFIGYHRAGFWIRALGMLIDTFVSLMIQEPIHQFVLGVSVFSPIKDYWSFSNLFLTYVPPALYYIMSWIYLSATPGKLLLNMKIVDLHTGSKMTPLQSVQRYLWSYVSALALGLGYLAVGWRQNKRAWHDNRVGTQVVRKNKD